MTCYSLDIVLQLVNSCAISESQHFAPTQQWSSWSYCYTFLSSAFEMVSGSSWDHMSLPHTLWRNIMLWSTYCFSTFWILRSQLRHYAANFTPRGSINSFFPTRSSSMFNILLLCYIISTNDFLHVTFKLLTTPYTLQWYILYLTWDIKIFMYDAFQAAF
jgi:uncharacterized protein (DUF2062 family)